MNYDIEWPQPLTESIETVVLTVVAIAIIIIDREMFFSRKHLADSERMATRRRVMGFQGAGK